MSADNSSAASTGRSGGGGASPDTYIGSLISLTSKSEIRYEGILYNINTEESSIGLRNVRSYGTEGRKLEAPQVPASDKIYEYILFRGSDIKDLQVKSSPPPQTTPSINSDPAIIQSHYPRPTAPTTSLPTAPTGSLPDLSSHSAQMGLPASTFQGGLPLYQPGGNSWGPSPPNVNGTNLAVPMYWPGFYGTPGGVPQLPQQSLLRPPHGLSIHPSMQQMQYPGFNASLPAAPSSFPSSNLLDHHSQLPSYSASPSSVTSSSLPTSSFPLSVPPLQPLPLPSETMVNVLPNKSPVSTIPTSTPSSSLPSLAQPSASVVHNPVRPSIPNKLSASPGPAALAARNLSQPLSSVSPISGPVLAETPTPSLITPGQLLQSGPPAVSAAQPLQTMQKDVEVVEVSSRPSVEPPTRVAPEAQPPLLPLPSSNRANKPNGSYGHQGGYSNHGGHGSHGGAHRYNYRGRGGRGPANSHPVTKFSQEFDFMAMNEKFNKDEVWGHLGKSNKNKGHLSESDEEDSQYEDDSELPKIEIKALYNKDDFFDSLSCNALDNDPNHGRTRYSEQMKLDTETFGDFSRYRGRGGRGGRGPGRGGGGGRFRGSYYGGGRGGGGYGGYGYGGNRGRGHNM